MNPDGSRIIDCVVTVANGDHTGEYVAAATFGGMVLVIVVGLVLWAWLANRDPARDKELNYYRGEYHRMKRDVEKSGVL